MNSDNLLDLSASAAFQLTHPLQFQLLDENDRPNIYILDDVNGQKANINLKNVSGHALVFEAPANSTAVPAAGLYHLELRFRPGTLADSSKSRMQLTDSTWKMSAPQDNNDGTVSYYLLSKSTLTLIPGGQTVLHLDNIGAEPAGGGRGTNVLLGYQVKYQGSDDPIQGHRQQHISILNHRGKERLPLHVGFLGYNRIQKDGSKADTALTLKLAFEPTDRDTQPAFQLSRGHAGMDDASTFFLNWDVQANNATGNQLKEWALGTEDDLKDVVIEVLDKNGNADPKWEITAEDAGLSPSRKLKLTSDLSLSPGDHIRIRISNFQSSLPNGHTHLYLHYQNIPGYWDGTFVCAVERAPLVFKGENVGIGTASPKNKLDVEGAVAIGAAYSGTNTAPANGLIVEGNVGIGTTNPNAKLQIGEKINWDWRYRDSNTQLVINSAVDNGGNNPKPTISMLRMIREGVGGQTQGNQVDFRLGQYKGSGADSQFDVYLGGSNFNPQQVMTMLSNGNVGIGTADPSTKLEIDAGGGTNVGLMVNGRIKSEGGNGGLWIDHKKFIGTLNENSLGFWFNENELLITLGNANEWRATLDVGRGAAKAGTAALRGTERISHFNFDTDEHTYIRGGKKNSNVLINDSGGKVGIGTADPGAELEIDAGGGANVGLIVNGRIKSEGGNGGLWIDQKKFIGTFNENSLGFWFNTSDLLITVGNTDDGWRATLDVGRGTAKSGTAAFRGTNRTSHFNNDTDEHTYIRGGKTNSNVLINDNGGNVGIGADSPTKAKLVVQGYVNGKVTPNGLTRNYTAFFSDVIAAEEFFDYSDARIKTIIGQSDNACDLQTLMGLQITDYRMKDPMKGADLRKKVIGQQVEEVFPQAVSQITDVIPDIQQMADVNEGWVLLPASLQAGERVKLIFGGSAGVYEVQETGDQGFRVELPADIAQVFVYGREVDDFRLVDYTALSMLHLSATQALIRRVEDLEALVEAKKNGQAAVRENGAD